MKAVCRTKLEASADTFFLVPRICASFTIKYLD
jgi:hypothetical protein